MINTTRHQLRALGYGVFLMIVALLVYLPWMAKNFVWTGNPLYPLFNQHLELKHHNPAKPVALELRSNSRKSGKDDLRADTSGIGSHFVVRKFVYGESWWETASIPIRIFFQGRDDDPKFFDGKLNPFLLILPLLLLFRSNRFWQRFKREVRLFAIFAILYLLFVFFQIDMRIRWISPVIPPLAILSSMGLFCLKRFCDNPAKRRAAVICTLGFWLMVTVLFWFNFVYIAHLFKWVDPISYLSGRVSRDAYIQRFRPEYAALKFANQQTPQDATILCLFLGNRRYYSDRPVNFNYHLFRRVVKQSASAQEAARLLKNSGITHIIVRHDLFEKWVHDNFTPAEKHVILLLFSEQSQTLFSKDGYTLMKIRSHEKN